MATNKDTENNSPSAPAPADNDISMLTKVTKQDLAEAIVDEYGAKYSKDGKKLLKAPKGFSNYNIKEGTEIIGDSAFYNRFLGCRTLTSIIIPSSVIAIGEEAFHGCSSLTSITIPSSVATIGKGTFSSCKSLTSIAIPPSVHTMKGNPFVGWHGQIEVDSPFFKYEDGALVDVEKGVLIAFCSKAESYTIPPNVNTIGDYAFSSCKSLTSISISPSVTAIGEEAFWNCSSLTSVAIPPSVTSIGSSAFSHCI